MSTIKALLKDVPVEWKALGDVLKIKNGKDYKGFKTGNIPVYGSGGVMSYIDTFVFNQPSVLIPRKGSLKNLFYVDEPFWTVDTIFWTDINIEIVNPKFVYYYLKTQKLEELNMAGGVPSLTQAVLNKLPFPIPYPNDPEKSLAVQQEIVRVLDGLSEQNNALTTALAQEIDQRKKQYAYYREDLFRFEGKEVEWKTLGEVSYKISSGKNKSKSSNGKYPLFGSTGIIGKTDTLSFTSDKLLVARVGANAGFVYIASGEYDVSDNALVIENKEHIAMFYLYYYLTDLNLNRFAKGAGQPLVTGTFLKEIKIPVPSIQEQERIVHLLDQFDEATKNIVAQLEKEIELRNKQYNYYRNHLLTFPKE
jgi:type I restriction enzyme S subunit